MVKNMNDSHRQKFYEIIIIGLLTLFLFIFSKFFFLGDLRKWGFFILYLFAGREVLVDAFRGIIRGSALDENFLMTVATLTAFFIGEYLEAVAVMLFYSFGELFEDIATYRSRENIKSLIDLVPEVANRLKEDGTYEEVDLDDIEVGDILLIRDGEKIGVDGKIVEGSASLDTSSITGESMPVEAGLGDSVLSSSIVSDGIIKIEVENDFDDSYAAKIMELIEDSAGSKSNSEKFVTRFAKIYTPIVVGLAIALALIPPLFFGGDFNDYLFRAATFLVLSCPCALVLSVPLSFMSGLGLASKNGILVKGSQFFERLEKANTLLTDKTGTLTTGKFKIRDIKIEDGFDKDYILDLVYNLEKLSTHPIGSAVVDQLAREDKNDLFKDSKNIKGRGISAISLDGREIKLGSSKFLGLDNKDARAIFISLGGKLAGSIYIEDDIKEKSKDTILRLKEDFTKIAIVSGDNEISVSETSKKLGLDDYYAEVMPDEKLHIMEDLSKDGGVVFVGDGINDSPVLKNASVGISMGESSSDLAIEASDILITNGQFSQMARLMDIARLTNKTVRENVTFIMLVKLTILLLGLFGYASMWLAIFGDVGVSIITILWAMRILGKKV
ncbi:MAG: heavy metal translocating P-type ATPase [Anaerococcus sp.]|nr:heavy metal translocating P-type ATPase [Anaerococcus sp.]